MYEVRRRLERVEVTVARGSAGVLSLAVRRTGLARDLQELIPDGLSSS
jgi:hypothetical protein